MKNIKIFLFLAALAFVSSCSEEKLDSNSIFDTSSVERSKFDTWIMNNYTLPYNMQVNWKYVDKESDMSFNLIPAEEDKAEVLTQYIKHVWVDAYIELMGKDFLCTYTPRVLQFIGSKAYLNKEEYLGTAEGGMKITLYNVNGIDLNKVDLGMLNYYFFKVMHHEFAHILHQTKNYSTDFNLISAASYRAGDWINLDDPDAPAAGFVTGYASKEPNEDFVELISVYVTHDQAYWDALLASGGTTGAATILSKFAIVKDYLKSSWQIDIDKLREIVLRRTAEIPTLKLETFK